MSEPALLPAVVNQDIERIRQVGYWLSLSESGVENEKTLGAAAALRIYYVEQLGLPALATAGLSVIKGKVFVGGDLARALAGRAGYRVVRVASDNTTCTAALVDVRTGEEVGRTTFTIKDATDAGLVGRGGAWKTYPARMLWQRASKYVIQDYAPEVLLGIYLDDEQADFDPSPPTPEPTSGSWPGGGVTVRHDPAPAPADLAPAVAAEAEDGEWEPAGRVESDTDRKLRLHRRLAVLCDKAETDSKMLLPQGHESWEAYSRWLAKEQFGVDSRADLTADQLAALVDQVQAQQVPF